MRQYVERQIIRALIDAALFASFLITVHNGEETVLIKSRDADAIMKEMFTTDDEMLYFYKSEAPKETFGWIKLVYGNSGPDVISDYTTNLEHLMKKPNAISDYWDADGPWKEFDDGKVPNRP